MKVPLGRLSLIKEVLDSTQGTRLEFDTTVRVKRNLRKIIPELEPLDIERNQLITELGKDGMINDTMPGWTAFVQRYNQAASVEVDIDLDRFGKDELRKIEISGVGLDAMSIIIDGLE